MSERFEVNNFTPEEEKTVETTRPFDLNFYVTDHSPDFEDTGNPETLKRLYEDIKKDGIKSVRYDWRWNNIMPSEDKVAEDNLNRYGEAISLMKEVGLEPPTIVLSSIPGWALEIYKKDKEAFFEEYKKYIENVKVELAEVYKDTGVLVPRVQVLNELNGTIYNPIAHEDVPRLCEITREVLAEYNPDIKLLGTLFAGNLPDVLEKVSFGLVKIGIPVEEYLEKYRSMLDSFDVLAVDYYPGMWHVPVREANANNEEIFKQLGLLKRVMETIASWNKEYEIGEVGIQTNIPLMSAEHNEKRQRYFYDVFFREFKQLLLDMQRRGVALPTQVGLYEAVDEAPKNLKNKILRKITPYPEHDMGVRRSDMGRKEIGKGARYLPEEERENSPSQLSRIIKYMNTPVRKEE